MAKVVAQDKFQNAYLDLEAMEITEVKKDEEITYNLMGVLKKWNGVEGITLSIGRNKDVDGDEYDKYIESE